MRQGLNTLESASERLPVSPQKVSLPLQKQIGLFSVMLTLIVFTSPRLRGHCGG